MEGRKSTPSRAAPKGKSPAERSEEFSATQRKLKEEAAARRDAASKSGGAKRKR
jgi:hypothetical protein